MTQKTRSFFKLLYNIWFDLLIVCVFVCVYKKNEVKLSFNANKIYNKMQWIIYVVMVHYADPLAFTERIKSTDKIQTNNRFYILWTFMCHFYKILILLLFLMSLWEEGSNAMHPMTRGQCCHEKRTGIYWLRHPMSYSLTSKGLGICPFQQMDISPESNVTVYVHQGCFL